jgi:hypothetical protein
MRRAETRWLPQNSIPPNASLAGAVNSEAMPGSGVVDPDGYRTIKATIGALAIIAAATAGAGTAMTSSLFGALAALALSAGAGLAALLELTHADRHRGWRLGAWGTFVPAWIACAAMLLNAPLGHLDGLRLLISVLIAGRVALQVWRWRAHQCSAPLGVGVVLALAPLALAATWSGLWLQLGETPVTAISIACALELFGTGSIWLAEAIIARPRPVARDETAGLPAAPAMQMA